MQTIDNTQELASIKRPGEVDHCSDEEFEHRIREIAKCKRDIVHFAENYFRIISLDKGLHVIKLYDVQKEFLKFLTENNKVICVSGRQQGKCIFRDCYVTVKNKKTNKTETLKIGDFFKKIKRVFNIYV